MPKPKTRQQYRRDSHLYAVLAALMLTLAVASHLNAQGVGDPRDLTRLPLGDYKLSNSAQIGYVYRCGTGANAGIGGAQVDGPWIKADGTFDFTAKAIVDGDVAWPQHTLTIRLDADIRRIEGNDLPDHTTGIYPISTNDDAYQYDRNPNRIGEQSLVYALPANPTVAAQPHCLTPGAVGVLTTGVVIFDALDALNRDAVAHETQDHCQGHPEVTGEYHYHSLTDCLKDEGVGHSALVGYALDGFGIYGVRGENGDILTNADLDECHGHTHEVEWDGRSVSMYHYHATYEFPYTVGCFRGVPVVSNQPNNQQTGSQNQSSSQNGLPDLARAAQQLGVSEAQLRDALGPPPPDLRAAARRLGVSEGQLRAALGVP
ncbi:MAG: YHYH protein [Anaerolineae bacterium]